MRELFLQDKYKPNILIVDDTPANLRVLATMLKARGYQVRIAPSGRLALQFVARSQPDLILLDIFMPDIDGYAVCRQLKENKVWSSIPVIFISGRNDMQGKVRSFEVGGVDYITKPFQYAEVEARVETHIKLRLYQRHLEELVEQKTRELVQAQEKIAKTEKISILGVMTAGIAHEISQPLNAIKLLASNLVLSYAEGRRQEISQYVDSCKEISRQTDRIKEIISHFRSFIRNDANSLQPCSLNTAISNSLKMVGMQLNDHGIIVKQTLQPDLPYISATYTGLETVLLNLLLNSMRALDTLESPEKYIILRTYMDKDVILEVIDNGPGIAEELRTKIFDPLVSTKHSANNLGLGLAIVKNIIASFKGRIEIVSGSENQTAFTIVFPSISKEV